MVGVNARWDWIGLGGTEEGIVCETELSLENRLPNVEAGQCKALAMVPPSLSPSSSAAALAVSDQDAVSRVVE